MKVSINAPKVSAGTVGSEFLLVHVPSDQQIILDDNGKKIWKKIEAGTDEIETLIQQHSQENAVSREVAAFQVLSFLDELKSLNFVNFALDKDKAPLLDTPVGYSFGGSRAVARVIVHEQKAGNVSLKDLLAGDKIKDKQVFENPKPELAIKQVVESVNKKGFKGKRVQVADNPGKDISLDSLTKQLPEKIIRLEKPKESISLGDVLQLHEASFRTTAAPARVIVIVIIAGDDIIIIVISEGPGPSRGKSRSACKTMCV